MIAAHEEIFLISSFCARPASVWRRATSAEWHGQRVLEDRPERVDPLVDADRVVEHITQRPLQLLVDAVLLRPAAQPLQHPAQGVHGPLEVDDLAGELVDAAGERAVVAVAEEFVLDLVDVVQQPATIGSYPSTTSSRIA